MAEFTEVMHQWKRMCVTLEREYADSRTECGHCTLGGCCAAIWEMSETTDWDAIADKVLAWAKENPEPVYPSFREWLIAEHMLRHDLDSPLPAAFAQKYGIKPKEDA